ncbi:putative diguanylate cyclase AdrA [Thalassocella blandensis]|nr:putative diguanylate cyclase AdrA [Thalassocella blandensis]
MSGGERKRNKIGFARRIHASRTIGLILAGIAFIPAFYELQQPLWVWLAFGGYFLVWPHLAYLWSSIYNDSLRMGQNHLLIDAFCCGIGVAAMKFHLVPSAILMTMVALNNISSGGLPLFSRGLIMQVLGIFAGTWVFGWHPQWQNSVAVTIACLPMLAIYPLAIGLYSYRFATRIHEQKLQLRKLSRTDGLTGLYNRTYWQLRAVEEFERCERNRKHAVLIMLDIDHFKNINDTYGHDVGDDVIRRVSEVLNRQLRNIDIIGRFGGEEFCIVLPDITVNDSKKIAERLRILIASESIGQGNINVQCTVSLGIAEFTQHLQGVDEWIKAADTALYEAKNNGRNCYCIAPATKGLHLIGERSGEAAAQRKNLSIE